MSKWKNTIWLQKRHKLELTKTPSTRLLRRPIHSGPWHFRHWGPVSWKTIFPWPGRWGQVVQDDSSPLHLLCTLFLVLLHQLQLILSGTRFQRLGTPCHSASPILNYSHIVDMLTRSFVPNSEDSLSGCCMRMLEISGHCQSEWHPL